MARLVAVHWLFTSPPMNSDTSLILACLALLAGMILAALWYGQPRRRRHRHRHGR